MSDTNNPVQLFSELLGGPLGELISSVGQGVGDAQAALDHGALQQTLDMYDLSKDADRSPEELQLLSVIRSMGYQPTFYTIPETEVEAQISLSLDLKSEPSGPVAGNAISRFRINATPLNAGNVNRYGLQSNAMAKLKFKIVPVPPNQGVTELRIVPELVAKHWNNDKKELLENLGFAFELRDEDGELIQGAENPSEMPHQMAITDQIPQAGTIANINTKIVLTLTEVPPAT